MFIVFILIGNNINSKKLLHVVLKAFLVFLIQHFQLFNFKHVENFM